MADTDTAEAVSFDDFDLEETVTPEVPDEAPINDIEPKEPEQEAPASDLLEAPEFWSKEQKELFTQLQGFENSRGIAEGWVNQWNDNQKYITQKSQSLADERRQFENQLNEYNHYQQALQGILPTWQAQGIAPSVGIAQMAHYGQMLHTDPQALIHEVAKFAGIDLNQLVEDQPYIDPAVQDRLRTLEQINQQLQQAIGQNQQGQQEQQLRANVELAQRFIDAKGEDGNALHPHIQQDSPYAERIGQDVLFLLQNPNSDIAQTTDISERFKKAYEKAVQFHPDIQNEIKEAQEKAAAKERQAKAEEAKKASVRTDSKSKDAPKRNPSNINEIFDDFSLGDD